MREKSYGGILVILFICILAFGFGTVGGMLHLGEEYCKDIIPISVSTPADTVSVIDEQNFEAKNITVQLYIPKPVVKKPTNTTPKNYTNNTYNKTNKSSNTDYNHNDSN